MSNEQLVTRKLRAILSADVKGYSLLMADDEVHTIQTLKLYRKIMAEIIQQHSGRVVDNPGDNLLAEFASSIDAVSCAVQIQNRLKKENAKFVENKWLQFRIGVNIGDVVQDGERIYGNGVNIAARIEGIASAGGICISQNTYDHVKDKLDVDFEYLGEHEFKNIEENIGVYKALFESDIIGRPHDIKKFSSKVKWSVISIAILMVIFFVFLGGMYWKYFYLPSPNDIDPENRINFELPKGPSIAVLPFDNLTGDTNQEYFCDGITEIITSALAHVPNLFVIARNSAFSFKGKPTKAQIIGLELGVDYIIEGSIQALEDKVRIAVQLIETRLGNHVWSEIYDKKLVDIINIQDEVTIDILKNIKIQIVSGEQIRGLYEGVSDLNTFIKCLKASKYFWQMNKESNNQARNILLEINKEGKQIPYTYTLLGFTYIVDIFFGACNSPIICLGKGTEAARHALSLNPNYYAANQLVGQIFLFRKEHKKAIDALKHALSINPNDADSYECLGMAYQFSGYPYKGIDYINKAITLNPFPPSDYLVQLGIANLTAQKHQEAIEAFKKSVQIEPKNIFAHIGLVGAYIESGNDKEAFKEVKSVIAIDPNFSVENFTKALPYKNADYNKRYAASLRKAGLPD